MAFTRRSFLKMAGVGTIAATFPRSIFAESNGDNSPNFSFIQLTDTHIPDENGIERSKKVVDAINNFSMPYEMIIHTGDVSDGMGNSEDMKKALALLQFKKKAYFLPGNADVTFDHPEKHENTFKSIFGSCNQSILPFPNLRFVLFNSQPLSNECANDIREIAFSRLINMLTPSMPTILFCHATGLPDFYQNKMHDGWQEKTMKKWAKIMMQGGVFAVLAGHFHRDEYHFLETIPVHICSPVVGWFGRQTTFRYWNLNSHILTYRTIYI
jgi:predicted MPP superfamily phosphohydrolase